MLRCVFRSGRQGDRMPSTDVNSRALAWRKSSHSVNAGACIQVAALADGVATRDSAGKPDDLISFPRTAWRSFIDVVKGDHLRPLSGRS
jgi:hypothetical protein